MQILIQCSLIILFRCTVGIILSYMYICVGGTHEYKPNSPGALGLLMNSNSKLISDNFTAQWLLPSDYNYYLHCTLFFPCHGGNYNNSAICLFHTFILCDMKINCYMLTYGKDFTLTNCTKYAGKWHLFLFLNCEQAVINIFVLWLESQNARHWHLLIAAITLHAQYIVFYSNICAVYYSH